MRIQLQKQQKTHQGDHPFLHMPALAVMEVLLQQLAEPVGYRHRVLINLQLYLVVVEEEEQRLLLARCHQS